jgi:hypothetical protein
MIGGRFEDLLPLVAAGNDVVERAFEFYPGLAGHGRKLVKDERTCQYLIT